MNKKEYQKYWKINNRDKVLAYHKKRYNKPGVKYEFANYSLQKNYGITIQDKESMFRIQNGKCLICDEKFESISKAHVDHNHKTKQIRGLLCQVCNLQILTVVENYSELVKIAKGYLEFYDELYERKIK